MAGRGKVARSLHARAWLHASCYLLYAFPLHVMGCAGIAAQATLGITLSLGRRNEYYVCNLTDFKTLLKRAQIN